VVGILQVEVHALLHKRAGLSESGAERTHSKNLAEFRMPLCVRALSIFGRFGFRRGSLGTASPTFFEEVAGGEFEDTVVGLECFF
jgi:hypothetical protein